MTDNGVLWSFLYDGTLDGRDTDGQPLPDDDETTDALGSDPSYEDIFHRFPTLVSECFRGIWTQRSDK